MAKPKKPIVPAGPLLSEPETFSAKAEASALFLPTFATYLDEIAEFVDTRAAVAGGGISEGEARTVARELIASWAETDDTGVIPIAKIGDRTITGSKIALGTITAQHLDFTPGSGSSSTGAETAASILRKFLENSDTNVFTDADHTKLNGIATGANATPTATTSRRGTQEIATQTEARTGTDALRSMTPKSTKDVVSRAVETVVTNANAAHQALQNSIDAIVAPTAPSSGLTQGQTDARISVKVENFAETATPTVTIPASRIGDGTITGDKLADGAVPDATETTKGIGELAGESEARDPANRTKLMTPERTHDIVTRGTTASKITATLEATAGDARLDASAIKNLPSGGGTTGGISSADAQAKVDVETAAREAADTALGLRITNEASGQTEAEVQALVKAGVIDSVEAGNTDTLPAAKIPLATLATSAFSGAYNADDSISFTITNRTGPKGIAVAGGDIIIANQNGSENAISAYSLDDHTRNVPGDYVTLDIANVDPIGISTVGPHIYVADYAAGALFVYLIATKAVVPGKKITCASANNRPLGVWIPPGGTKVITSQSGTTTTLYEYDLATGDQNTTDAFSIAAHADNTRIDACVGNATYFWAVDGGANRVFGYLVADGSYVAAVSFDLHASNTDGTGAWIEGNQFMVSDRGTNIIYFYDLMTGVEGSAGAVSLATDSNIDSAAGDEVVTVGGLTRAIKAIPAPSTPAGSYTLPQASITKLGGVRTASQDNINDGDATFSTDPLAVNPEQMKTVTDALGTRIDNLPTSGAAPRIGRNYGKRKAAQDFTTLLANGNGNPQDIAEDGDYTYVLDSIDKKIYVYDTDTKEAMTAKNISLSSLNGNPGGMTIFDGHVYVGDTVDRKHYAYNLTTRGRRSAKDIPAHANQTNIQALDNDGSTLFSLDFVNDRVFKYSLATKSNTGTTGSILTNAGNTNPHGIGVDETHMFITDIILDKVFAYKKSDNSHDSEFDLNSLIAAGNTSPLGIMVNRDEFRIVDLTAVAIFVYVNRDGVGDVSSLTNLEEDIPDVHSHFIHQEITPAHGAGFSFKVGISPDGGDSLGASIESPGVVNGEKRHLLFNAGSFSYHVPHLLGILYNSDGKLEVVTDSGLNYASIKMQWTPKNGTAQNTVLTRQAAVAGTLRASKRYVSSAVLGRTWKLGEEYTDVNITYSSTNKKLSAATRAREVTKTSSLENVRRALDIDDIEVVDDIKTVIPDRTRVYMSRKDNVFYRFDRIPGNEFVIKPAFIGATVYGYSRLGGTGTSTYIKGGSIDTNNLLNKTIAIYSGVPQSNDSFPVSTVMRIVHQTGRLGDILVNGKAHRLYRIVSNQAGANGSTSWTSSRYDEYVTHGDELAWSATSLESKRILITNADGTDFLASDTTSGLSAYDIDDTGEKRVFTDVDKQTLDALSNNVIPYKIAALAANIRVKGDSSLLMSSVALGGSHGAVGFRQNLGHEVLDTTEFAEGGSKSWGKHIVAIWTDFSGTFRVETVGLELKAVFIATQLWTLVPEFLDQKNSFKYINTNVYTIAGYDVPFVVGTSIVLRFTTSNGDLTLNFNNTRSKVFLNSRVQLSDYQYVHSDGEDKLPANAVIAFNHGFGVIPSKFWATARTTAIIEPETGQASGSIGAGLAVMMVDESSGSTRGYSLLANDTTVVLSCGTGIYVRRAGGIRFLIATQSRRDKLKVTLHAVK